MIQTDNRLGTAEWMPPEVVSERYPYQSGSFWLGRTTDLAAEPLAVADDRHVLIVGGTRGGKGTTVLIPNLCLWPGSALVIDPKGENATVTAERRGSGNPVCEGIGQTVHVLDPYGVADVPDEMRACFNPLDWISSDDPLCTKKAERLATSLVPFKDKSEEYWDNESRQLIGALIVHVATSPFFEERRDLLTVRDLVMRGDMETYDFLKDQGVDNLASPLEYLWQTMKENAACESYVRDSGTYFEALAKTSDRQWAGVRGGVKVATDFMTSAGMRACLKRSDFAIREFKTAEEGTTVYLSIPQDFIRTDCGWLRMLIDMTATEMKLVAGRPAAGHDVLMMLDEFAGLQRMDVIEESIAQLAGYGIKMVCVVQNIGQLRSTYDDNWETFVSGAGVRVFFGNEDQETRDYASKLAGESEVVRELKNRNTNRGTSTASQTGTSWDRSRTTQEGTSGGKSRTYGMSYDRNKGKSFEGKGRTQQGRTKGSSKGGNVGFGRERGWNESSSTSESEGGSESFTEGTNESTGEGVSESLHKRFLVEPHEVGKAFARVDREEDPRYPGHALVMISGDDPMRVRKCNYFEDPLFVNRYTPHPDHDFVIRSEEELARPFSCVGDIPPPDRVLALNAPDSNWLDLFQTTPNSQDVESFLLLSDVERGSYVEKDELVAEFPVDHANGFLCVLREAAGGDAAISADSPICGFVYAIVDVTEPTASFAFIEPSDPELLKQIMAGRIPLDENEKRWKLIVKGWRRVFDKAALKITLTVLGGLAVGLPLIYFAFRQGGFWVGAGVIAACWVAVSVAAEKEGETGGMETFSDVFSKFFEMRDLLGRIASEDGNAITAVVCKTDLGLPSFAEKAKRERMIAQRKFARYDRAARKLVPIEAESAPDAPVREAPKEDRIYTLLDGEGVFMRPNEAE